jgi:hypothetical protein
LQCCTDEYDRCYDITRSIGVEDVNPESLEVEVLRVWVYGCMREGRDMSRVSLLLVILVVDVAKRQLGKWGGIVAASLAAYDASGCTRGKQGKRVVKRPSFCSPSPTTPRHPASRDLQGRCRHGCPSTNSPSQPVSSFKPDFTRTSAREILVRRRIQGPKLGESKKISDFLDALYIGQLMGRVANS